MSDSEFRKGLRNVSEDKVLTAVLAAESLSKIGDWITFVASNVLIYQLGGGIAVGAFHLSRGVLPVIFGSRAGALVNRYRPIELMAKSDMVRAVLIAGVGALASIDGLNAWLAIALLGLVASIGALFRPAQMSVFGTRTSDDLRPMVTGLLTFVQTASLAVGPVIAGVLMTWFNPGQVIFIDAISYLSSAFLLWRFRSAVDPLAAEDSGRETSLGVIKVARNFLSIGGVRLPYLTHLASHIVAGSVFVLIIGVAQSYSNPSLQVGVLTGLVGVGSMIGALVATTGKNFGGRKALVSALWVCVAFLPLATVSAVWPVVAASIFLLGVAANLIEPAAWVEYQRATPRELMGQSFGFVDASTTTAVLGAAAVTGFAVDEVSTTTIGLVTALVVAVLGAGGLMWSSAGQLDPQTSL